MLTKITKDLLQARKDKDSDKLKKLSYFKSLLIENTKAKTPKEEMEVLISYKKQLDKLITVYNQFPEEQEKVKQEITLLSSYLPKQLTDSEIKDILKKVVNDATDKNFGKIMKDSMSQLKGMADGKKISTLLKEILK